MESLQNLLRFLYLIFDLTTSILLFSFCFWVMSCCLFCGCLCFSLWLVFWLLLSPVVIWNIDIFFFIFLVVAAKFFKSYVNLYFIKYQIHEWNKTFDFQYVRLGIWYVFTPLSFPAFDFWSSLISSGISI